MFPDFQTINCANKKEFYEAVEEMVKLCIGFEANPNTLTVHITT
jgi:hypothetical protein